MSYTLISNWVLLTGLLALIPFLQQQGIRTRLVIVAAVPVILSIPLNQITLSGYLHTLTAQLSIGSMALMAAFAARRLFQIDWFPDNERRLLLYGLALFSPVYYYTALGFTQFDAYAHGFIGNPVGYLLIALALTALGWKYRAIAMILALVAIAPYIPLGESNNAFDYLVDVWLAIYAIGRSITNLLKTAWRRRKG